MHCSLKIRMSKGTKEDQTIKVLDNATSDLDTSNTGIEHGHTIIPSNPVTTI